MATADISISCKYVNVATFSYASAI